MDNSKNKIRQTISKMRNSYVYSFVEESFGLIPEEKKEQFFELLDTYCRKSEEDRIYKENKKKNLEWATIDKYYEKLKEDICKILNEKNTIKYYTIQEPSTKGNGTVSRKKYMDQSEIRSVIISAHLLVRRCNDFGKYETISRIFELLKEIQVKMEPESKNEIYSISLKDEELREIIGIDISRLGTGMIRGITKAEDMPKLAEKIVEIFSSISRSETRVFTYGWEVRRNRRFLHFPKS